MPVTPCRIVDTRNAGGMIDAYSGRDFHVYGSGGTISAQGGNPDGCPAPLGEPRPPTSIWWRWIPTGKGNLQAFPVGAGPGSGMTVNYNAIDTNLANAGSVKTVYRHRHGYHGIFRVFLRPHGHRCLGVLLSRWGSLYIPVKPCRIVDTRNAGGIIGACSGRDFHVYGSLAHIMPKVAMLAAVRHRRVSPWRSTSTWWR